MPRPTKENTGATPSKYPDVTPPQAYPSGDYSYTLEVVMQMQATLGKLTEAVESLKGQSKSHGEKLEQIGKDVHAARIALTIIGSVLLAVIAAGAKAIFDHFTAK